MSENIYENFLYTELTYVKGILDNYRMQVFSFSKKLD